MLIPQVFFQYSVNFPFALFEDRCCQGIACREGAYDFRRDIVHSRPFPLHYWSEMFHRRPANNANAITPAIATNAKFPELLTGFGGV